ncbi:glycine oxidase ThiO [Nakamurella leprariae]|uniref:glycine oxidase n=1 Tax=Nakamurella leprariae TaxID=2803911 RepID=A0A938YHA0_9ACTN|nr:glycine oxidase ThiO [Nakamurella leprariae]MBM9469588.1 glycine oxidase ThiO [Nakamurella leprariae]
MPAVPPSVDRPGGRLVVLGGGVIGWSVAWRAALAGWSVDVVDSRPGRGSSWVAGGMLAPLTEGHPGEEALLELGSESLRRWPSFAGDLEAAAGQPCGLSAEGTVVVGLDSGDRAELARTVEYLIAQGRCVEILDDDEVHRLEPGLAPTLTSGLSISQERSVDNRALLAALRSATYRAGVRTVERAVAGLDDALVGDADQVVVAAGIGSPELLGASWSGAGALLVRPVKGEILRLRHRSGAIPVPRHTIRALVHGRSVYLVPRSDGVVVGATQHEAGTDTTVTVGGVRDLLADAAAVLPGLAEFELVEHAAGLRPTSPDGVPFIGRLDDRVVLATGHGRNGVLLAPLTADAVVAELAGTPVAAAKPADPWRFS